MVGHFVGSAGNAAIGVSWQVFLVIIAFIMSMFAGMSVLVSRYAGANNEEMVDWVVYQAFLVACFLSIVIFAPIGWFASPWLLDFVNASPAIQHEALPFRRGFRHRLRLTPARNEARAKYEKKSASQHVVTHIMPR